MQETTADILECGRNMKGRSIRQQYSGGTEWRGDQSGRDYYPGHHCCIPKCITVRMRQRAGNGYERSFHYKNQCYFMRRKSSFRQQSNIAGAQ